MENRIMKDQRRRTVYVRPRCEVLGMDDDVCLLHGSWEGVSISATRDSYSSEENLDAATVGASVDGSRDGYGSMGSLDD